MVHHTNHDKEFIKRKKKKKKRTFLFFVCFKKFDQVARTCLVMAMYIFGRGRQAVKMAGQLVAPLGVVRPRALLIKAITTQGSAPWQRPQLCSRGVPPLPQEPTSPVLVSQGLASPRTAGHRVGSRATWPWQAGSELWQQIEAGGRCHCCPDFFSFWKLKLVRLFSFLCF